MRLVTSRIVAHISSFGYSNSNKRGVRTAMYKIMPLTRQVRFARLWPVPGLLLCLTVSGCLAQQADLVQTRAELDERITALNKREQEIRDKVKQVDSLIDQEKQRLDRLNQQSANLGAQLSELQTAALSKIEDAQERQNKRIDDIANRLDNQLQKRVGESDKGLREQLVGVSSRIAVLESGVKDQARGLEDQAKSEREDQSRLHENLVKLRTRLEETNASMLEVTKRFEARLHEHDRALGAGDAKAGGIAQQVDQQSRSVTDQLAQFSRALGDFKIVLTGLADKLTQQEHVLAQQERVVQELGTDLNRRTEMLMSDAKATSVHLAEVNRSIGSVAKAVENMGGTLGTRIDQHDQKISELADAYQYVTAQVQTPGDRSAGQDQRVTEMTSPSTPNATPRREVPDPGTKRNGKTHKRSGPVEPENRSPQMAAADSDASVLAPTNDDVAIESQSASQTVASLGPADRKTILDGAGASSPEPPRPSARDAYESVLTKFRQGHLEAAQRGFSDFLVQYPGSDLAPNAQYWLGECYYGRRDYRRAIDAFNQVRQTYPRSEKVPAALLKASFAYLEVNERTRAAVLLREILESYPKSAEAGKAGAKLAQLEKKR